MTDGQAVPGVDTPQDLDTLPLAMAEQGFAWHALGVDDLAAVCALERQAHAHPWELQHFQDCLSAGYELRALKRYKQLLGYYVAMPNLDEIHLLNIAVSPDHQRQGFGRWMMHVLMARAVAAGSQSVWLEVRQSNHAAIALYNALGFVTLRQRKDYYPAANGQRENAWVMRWNALASVQASQGAAP